MRFLWGLILIVFATFSFSQEYKEIHGIKIGAPASEIVGVDGFYKGEQDSNGIKLDTLTSTDFVFWVTLIDGNVEYMSKDINIPFKQVKSMMLEIEKKWGKANNENYSWHDESYIRKYGVIYPKDGIIGKIEVRFAPTEKEGERKGDFKEYYYSRKYMEFSEKHGFQD